jgi:hypothetical protein
VRNPPREPAGAAELFAAWRQEDELRDVACAPLLGVPELAEELRDRGRPFRRIPSREDAGPAAERVHLEA